MPTHAAPMLFTESEFRRLADVQPLDSLACSRHAELLPEVAQQFLEWVQKNKQSCVELLNSGDFADDKVGSRWPFCLMVAPWGGHVVHPRPRPRASGRVS